MCIYFFPMQQQALAAETNLIQFKETIIHDYQKVEGILVIGNGLTVEGTVNTAVIVINGDLHIQKTAIIKGPILVIGGVAEQQQGAKIGEHLLALQFNDATQNSFLFAGALFLGMWIIRIMTVLSIGIFTILTGILMKQRMESMSTPVTSEWGRLLVTGAFASIALGAISVLLTISVIGIPIVIVLLVLSLLSLLIGMCMLSDVIAKKVKGLEDGPWWKKLTIGCAILLSFMSLPLIGGFVILLTLWLSFGVSIKWLVDRRKKR